MRSSTSIKLAVNGICCRMSFLTIGTSIIITAYGAAKAFGMRSSMRCDAIFGWLKVAMVSQVAQFLIANRSKPTTMARNAGLMAENRSKDANDISLLIRLG